jgi:hypothetical protein|tara:strand:- start:6523 stop:6981 length:459 start_codon:yes stop_codon:yes gene_type:complete
MDNFKIFNEAKTVDDVKKRMAQLKKKSIGDLRKQASRYDSGADQKGNDKNGAIGDILRAEFGRALMKQYLKDDVNEARVAPSADLTKPMTRTHAADLKRSLNISVDGLDALAWKLQYQFIGVDPKAIAQLKALHKEALKIQKAVVSAIGSAK